MIKARILLFVASLTLLSPAARAIFTDMHVIGDSISDNGNLFLATSSNPPFPVPVPQDPPYFQGRFSDGEVWVEYLYGSLGLGSLTPSFAGGTNFAVGGARTRYHTFDNQIPTFDPLTDVTSFEAFTAFGQLEALLSAGPIDPNALYVVYLGSNDIADVLALGKTDPADADQLFMRAANDVISIVAELVDAGATELLVPKVGDLGLIPEVLVEGPAAQATATFLSNSFNMIVDAGISGLDAEINRLDVFSLFQQLSADPTAFDLPDDFDTTDPCFTGFVGELGGTLCTDPENRAFFDRLHPSAVTQQLLGEIATDSVLSEPGSVILLALGLIGVATQRKTRRLG